MFSVKSTALAIFTLLLVNVLPLPASAEVANAPFMEKNGYTKRPIGHHEFCMLYRSECDVRSRKAARVHLTPDRWDSLLTINKAVNHKIVPVTDVEQYGREEVWIYPESKGDCEDFVLLKRRKLINAGWPVGSLLVTVVRQKNGDGHAVLTVLTDRGDLVLDNLEPQVKIWNDTEYQYVKRQSEFDSGRWVAIDDARTPLVGSLTR